MAKASVKNDQPTALDVYIAGGMNFASLVEALRSLTKSSAGQAETDKLLTELLKKLCLSAQGSRYAITLTKAEAPNFLQFLVIACEDTRDAGALLSALEARPASFREKYQDVIEGFLAKAGKVVPKLATHIQKTRNSSSKVDAFIVETRFPSDLVVGSEPRMRRITVTNVATRAKLGGQRWFWEATVFVESEHLQVDRLVAKNPECDWFWHTKSSPSLPLPRDRFPTHVGALSHQLLFETAEGGYVSLTPLTSVGGLSRLAAFSSPTLPWHLVEPVRYGGAKPNNIAALLMDSSTRIGKAGYILHPVNRPFISRPLGLSMQLKYLEDPDRLVSCRKLSSQEVEMLFSPHAQATTNSARQHRLVEILEPLLEIACSRLFHLRELFLRDEAPSILLQDENIFINWVKNSKSLSNSRYLALSQKTAIAALGTIGQRDFLRWTELTSACEKWLRAA